MKENWTYKKLGEVGTIITGSTPSTKDASNYASKDVCYFKPSDLDSHDFTILEQSEFHISQSAYEHSRQLPKDTILTTCIRIIGMVGILNIPATCINGLTPTSSKFCP